MSGNKSAPTSHDVRMSELSKGLLGELNTRDEERNRISLTEFSHYLPLFVRDLRSQLTEERLRTLSDDYLKRVDSYQPVTVYDDVTGKDLKVFPPITMPIHDPRDATAEQQTNKMRNAATSEIPKVNGEGYINFGNYFIGEQAKTEEHIQQMRHVIQRTKEIMEEHHARLIPKEKDQTPDDDEDLDIVE